jgi:hypothetical protein
MEISEDILDALMESMPRKMEQMIKNKGGINRALN